MSFLRSRSTQHNYESSDSGSTFGSQESSTDDQFSDSDEERVQYSLGGPEYPRRRYGRQESRRGTPNARKPLKKSVSSPNSVSLPGNCRTVQSKPFKTASTSRMPFKTLPQVAGLPNFRPVNADASRRSTHSTSALPELSGGGWGTRSSSMSRGPVSAVSQTAAQRKRGALSRSAGRRYSSRSLSESSRGRHETPGIAEVTSGGESSADSAGSTPPKKGSVSYHSSRHSISEPSSAQSLSTPNSPEKTAKSSNHPQPPAPTPPLHDLETRLQGPTVVFVQRLHQNPHSDERHNHDPLRPILQPIALSPLKHGENRPRSHSASERSASDRDLGQSPSRHSASQQHAERHSQRHSGSASETSEHLTHNGRSSTKQKRRVKEENGHRPALSTGKSRLRQSNSRSRASLESEPHQGHVFSSKSLHSSVLRPVEGKTLSGRSLPSKSNRPEAASPLPAARIQSQSASSSAHHALPTLFGGKWYHFHQNLWEPMPEEHEAHWRLWRYHDEKSWFVKDVDSQHRELRKGTAAKAELNGEAEAHDKHGRIKLVYFISGNIVTRRPVARKPASMPAHRPVSVQRSSHHSTHSSSVSDDGSPLAEYAIKTIGRNQRAIPYERSEPSSRWNQHDGRRGFSEPVRGGYDNNYSPDDYNPPDADYNYQGDDPYANQNNYGGDGGNWGDNDSGAMRGGGGGGGQPDSSPNPDSSPQSLDDDKTGGMAGDQTDTSGLQTGFGAIPGDKDTPPGSGAGDDGQSKSLSDTELDNHQNSQQGADPQNLKQEQGSASADDAQGGDSNSNQTPPQGGEQAGQEGGDCDAQGTSLSDEEIDKDKSSASNSQEQPPPSSEDSSDNENPNTTQSEQPTAGSESDESDKTGTYTESESEPGTPQQEKGKGQGQGGEDPQDSGNADSSDEGTAQQDLKNTSPESSKNVDTTSGNTSINKDSSGKLGEQDSENDGKSEDSSDEEAEKHDTRKGRGVGFQSDSDDSTDGGDNEESKKAGHNSDEVTKTEDEPAGSSSPQNEREDRGSKSGDETDSNNNSDSDTDTDTKKKRGGETLFGTFENSIENEVKVVKKKWRHVEDKFLHLFD